MYLDCKGLLTSAIGVLLDPMSAALCVPWSHPDGTPATTAEIAAEWNRVKQLKSLSQHGGGAYKASAQLWLDDDAITALVIGKLSANDAVMLRRFQGWDQWPADAQLGALSLAYAAGPHFRFPKFEAACNALDFATAAEECGMSEVGNAPLHPRNVANRQLFLNAAQVVSEGSDISVLRWTP